MCKRRRCVRNSPMRAPDTQFRCHQPCNPKRQTRCASSIHSSSAPLGIRMSLLPHADGSPAIKKTPPIKFERTQGVIQVTSRSINLFATPSTATLESNLGRHYLLKTIDIIASYNARACHTEYVVQREF